MTAPAQPTPGPKPIWFKTVRAHGSAGGWARGMEVFATIEGHADTVESVRLLVLHAPSLLAFVERVSDASSIERAEFLRIRAEASALLAEIRGAR